MISLSLGHTVFVADKIKRWPTTKLYTVRNVEMDMYIYGYIYLWILCLLTSPIKLRAVDLATGVLFEVILCKRSIKSALTGVRFLLEQFRKLMYIMDP